MAMQENKYKTITLSEISIPDAQNYLQYAIAPRPICLASTTDAQGNVNLSPFSFFNLFSTHPPVIIFSPSRSVRNNTTKHTLDNLHEVPEVVVNIVDYNMVQQVSLSSCAYEKGVDEFTKAGFTKMPSQLIKPPRVQESLVQMECKVLEIKSLGTEGGAGNLVIAEVLMMHINESILNEKGFIDQKKIHQVARLGGNWYAAINEKNLFEVAKPNTQLGIGFNNLPDHISNSKTLTGNELAQLANVHVIPTINPTFANTDLKNILEYYSLDPSSMEKELHALASKLLADEKVEDAWQVLLTIE